MDEREAALRAEVRRILEEAEAVDAAEDELYGDARGDELPEALRTREGRLRAIREAKTALEEEAREKSGDPEAVPEPGAQRNFTDPDSRIMHSKVDGFIYGYNAEAIVDEAHQVIVATALTAETTDSGSLPALVDQVEANTGRHPKRLLADAGYQSNDNLAHLADKGIDAYVAIRRDQSLAAASTRAPGSHPEGRHPTRAHGPQAAHEAGPGRVREAQGHRRAGLRPAQGGRRLPPLQPAGQGPRSMPSGTSSAPSTTWASCSRVAGLGGSSMAGRAPDRSEPPPEPRMGVMGTLVGLPGPAIGPETADLASRTRQTPADRRLRTQLLAYSLPGSGSMVRAQQRDLAIGPERAKHQHLAAHACHQPRRNVDDGHDQPAHQGGRVGIGPGQLCRRVPLAGGAEVEAQPVSGPPRALERLSLEDTADPKVETLEVSDGRAAGLEKRRFVRLGVVLHGNPPGWRDCRV